MRLLTGIYHANEGVFMTTHICETLAKGCLAGAI